MSCGADPAGTVRINHEKPLLLSPFWGLPLTCNGLAVTPSLLRSCITPQILTLFVGNSLEEEL